MEEKGIFQNKIDRYKIGFNFAKMCQRRTLKYFSKCILIDCMPTH